MFVAFLLDRSVLFECRDRLVGVDLNLIKMLSFGK